MAILRIERKANDLPVMKFASDNPVRNDLVFAIGNPHGQINSVGIGNVLGLAADYKLHIKLLKKYSIILYFFLVLLYNISKEWWHFYV